MTLLSCSLLAVSLASTALASPLSTSSYNTATRRLDFVPAPLYEEGHIHGTVNNSYIVVMRKDFQSPVLLNNHLNFLQTKHIESPHVGENSGLRHVYEFGYAGYFHDDVIDQVRALPEVDYVERDQIVRISDEVLDQPDVVVQKGAPWGLARISHRKKISLGNFNRYSHIPSGGDGVDAYIIDTGVDINHPEFEGRANWGKTIPNNDVDEDAHGHGTHCAGTIGSKSFGVAKQANLWAVKVLGSDGSGTMSDVVAGVEWASEHASEQAKSSKRKGAVANMSLGGGKSSVLDETVNRASRKGLFFAVAAGNDNRDACSSSPAAATEALTVGASTIGDERAFFSNYGKCVDIFGPGLNIKSTWPGDKINTISGTSMASPHVCGLAAYFLSIYPSVTFNPAVESFQELPSEVVQHPFSAMYSVAHAALPAFISSLLPPPSFVDGTIAPIPKGLTPAQLKQAIMVLGTKGMLSDLPPGTPDLLIFNNATA
ncbi:hypothetical protein D9757_006134 [Collybiopsis confluens]|uniref:Uncharacterized protein n=1 Tax=Collybiopsis confluens TaxID=2823264 RepID=A0A8H5M7A5_9AGAR|nr:hypothetical protein D9757_006134 [Collybiopsis confluens]